jgi:hypothetical protein
MNILYIVQPSNNDGEKWILQKDACFNIMRGIIQSFKNMYPDDSHIIVLPNSKQVNDINFYSLDLWNDNIEYKEIDYPVHSVLAKYHLDFNELARILPPSVFDRVDIIINDMNTIVPALNAYMKFHVGKHIPIVSTNYFYDSISDKKIDNKYRYILRQMEALVMSDGLAFVCDEAQKQMFDDLRFMNIHQVFDKTFEHLRQNSISLNIGGSYKEINEYKIQDTMREPIVYFANRITETVDRYTNWHVFAEAIGCIELYSNVKFEAFMTNPNNKASKKQIEEINRLSKGKIKLLDLSREKYLEKINKASVSVNLFEREVFGGNSHVEALMAGNFVIMPYVNHYQSHFERYYSGYLSKIDPHEIAQKIVFGLTQGRFFDREIFRCIGYKNSYENCADDFYLFLHAISKGGYV